IRVWLMALRPSHLSRRDSFGNHRPAPVKGAIVGCAGRSEALLPLGVDASPVVQMSCAPALVKMSLARVISAEFSVGTERRILPALPLPSYPLASISGMPKPINPPAI